MARPRGISIPYSSDVADRISAIVERNNGVRAGQIAREAGYENGYQIKEILQKLRLRGRIRGEARGSDSYMVWFPAQPDGQ